ncbi:MAG: DNA-processing protein DprA [Defluviitaleaceae bacterium]|nr:DNA-processing protein DprA [Defluviitaleaceae bacterium]
MDDKYLLWLSRVDGVNNKIRTPLLEHFGSAEAIFRARRFELQEAELLNEQYIHKIISHQDDKLLDGYLNELEETGIRFISLMSDEYPAPLREISDPPLGFYLLGTLPDPELCKVSIIGSRRCSEYGLSVAHKFSKELAQAGVVIVSGMARGIDSMAHRGTLDAGGVTVAVLGCGVDVCYPPENKSLIRRIQEKGCIISEYPPGTQPFPAHFPARNRIISGMSRATVVVEASRRSGTLITVDQALNEGREVMAVPGNVTSKLSEGTNNLIRQGAAPVTSSAEILDNLGITFDEPGEDTAAAKNTLAPPEKLVYDCIGFDPTAIEAVYDKLGSPPGEINYVLTLLEMRKLIRRLPGQRVTRL